MYPSNTGASNLGTLRPLASVLVLVWSIYRAKYSLGFEAVFEMQAFQFGVQLRYVFLCPLLPQWHLNRYSSSSVAPCDQTILLPMSGSMVHR